VQNNFLWIASALLASGYASQIETCGNRGILDAFSQLSGGQKYKSKAAGKSARASRRSLLK
jgi:hypothetical protein